MELKINYENGDYLYTRINASHEEAISYFVGKTFKNPVVAPPPTVVALVVAE